LKAEVEERGREIEELQEKKAHLEKEVSEQLRRLQLVTNRINRLTRDLKAKDKAQGGSGEEYAVE
jgi:predicted RNase H-like nuclease (RuvC/YqgF family)